MHTKTLVWALGGFAFVTRGEIPKAFQRKKYIAGELILIAFNART